MPSSSDAVVESSSLARLLYVSALAPGVPVTEVSRIVSAARQRNADDAITGLLVFDGDTFCQYVEGPPEAVEALLQRLHADPRGCYELPTAANSGTALGNMSMAKTRKCKPLSTSGRRS
jgi:hypothetical protein